MIVITSYSIHYTKLYEFAIAKLFAESETQLIVGGLSLQALAVGCILFTALMWRDIYAFGELLLV